MQETRRHILEILRTRGRATVDDIVQDLQKRRGKITAVTVRHHLNRLQQDDLVTSPQMLHRTTPGRPQHVYALTEQAMAYFPNNYQNLAASLLAQIETNLPSDDVNVILEGVADSMARQAVIPKGSLEERIKAVVEYLNEHGYDAAWERCDGGYLLHTMNCPYHHIATKTDSLCVMDMRLVSDLLGIVPRLKSRISDDCNACSYFIPHNAA